MENVEETEHSEELFSLSSNSSEKTKEFSAWKPVIKHLNQKGFEALKKSFKNKIINNTEVGLTKDEFKEAINKIYKNNKYDEQSDCLFDEISKNKVAITWNNLLDFLIDNNGPKSESPIQFTIGDIEPVPHMVRETISKIVVIEAEKYFCYAVCSKHGRIGIYDGNLNFLTSYHVIMGPEDEERTDYERRRRNRWITDAIFCLDIQMFLVTNSTRSIAIYEASGLKHEIYWLIVGVPEVIECLAYKGITKLKNNKSECILFAGTEPGNILHFKFKKPDTLLLRRKYTDKLNVFYWCELIHELSYLKIKTYQNIHNDQIKQMEYNIKMDSILSCSRDPSASLVKHFVSAKKSPHVLKLKKGVSCFAVSNNLKIIVTGSRDQTLRIWNIMLTSIVAIFRGHSAIILDVAIMDTLHMVISFSEDGVMKLWEINENKCVQSENINFPAFNILGKFIEYGRKNIYPGPKRYKIASVGNNEVNANKKYFGISDFQERPLHSHETIRETSNIWERSNILLTCCNYIARVHISYKDNNFLKVEEPTILPPPPLQNSVLIPAYWQNKNETYEENKEEEISDDLIKNLDFILNKDLFDIEGSKSDINYKISILEARKIQMKNHVAKGAPFLALNLAELKDIRLSDEIRKTDTRAFKRLERNISKLLKNAEMKDEAFNEISLGTGSRSTGSVRSSNLSII